MISQGSETELDDFGSRGDAWYEAVVAPHLKPEDNGRVAAIDVPTGDYEVAENELEASNRLLARKPDADIWLRRVGSRWLHKFGGGRR